MANSKVKSQVTQVNQRGDNTVVVYIRTGSFKAGQEVEVSVYLTQGETYAAHYEKKHIPYPDDPSNTEQPAVLHVELPATPLKADQEVTVLTRVAEVWSSVLKSDSKKLNILMAKLNEPPGEGPQAVWTYQDSEGKGNGDQESPPPGNGGGRVTTLPQEKPPA